MEIDIIKNLDSHYLKMDRKHLFRSANLRLIPSVENRKGGKPSYAEWAHVIGIFQTLMFIHLEQKENNHILDAGCGTGLVGIACEPFLGSNGHYVGIDVNKSSINFCKSHYPSSHYSFHHLETRNANYAPGQPAGQIKWNVDDNAFDLVTGLSLWTHLNEADACFYFKEVARVLKPGGKAILTLFLLDDDYRRSLSLRKGKPGQEKGAFHLTEKEKWIFDHPAYGSRNWFAPGWASVPEKAIGVTPAGLDSMVKNSGLNLLVHYPGNWKEAPGMYFQDIAIFAKK